MLNRSPTTRGGSSAVSDARHHVAATGRRPWTLLALGLFAVLAASSATVSPAVAFAQGRHGNHRIADITFTKWAIAPPVGPTTGARILMAGIVGRDAGPAGFTGEVLGGDITSRPGFWLGHARYQLHGPAFDFIADVRLANGDTRLPITATIRGVVTTEGRFDGARVAGEFIQLDTCPIPEPGELTGVSCWRVTLHLTAEGPTGGAPLGVAA